jgi:hypothetical protein
MMGIFVKDALSHIRTARDHVQGAIIVGDHVRVDAGGRLQQYLVEIDEDIWTREVEIQTRRHLVLGPLEVPQDGCVRVGRQARV